MLPIKGDKGIAHVLTLTHGSIELYDPPLAAKIDIGNGGLLDGNGDFLVMGEVLRIEAGRD